MGAVFRCVGVTNFPHVIRKLERQHREMFLHSWNSFLFVVQREEKEEREKKREVRGREEREGGRHM